MRVLTVRRLPTLGLAKADALTRDRLLGDRRRLEPRVILAHALELARAFAERHSQVLQFTSQLTVQLTLLIV